jgi:hypothetical protein
VIERLPFTAANILVDVSRGSTLFEPAEAEALALVALSVVVGDEIVAARQANAPDGQA